MEANTKSTKTLKPFRLSDDTQKELAFIRTSKGFNDNTKALEFALEMVAKSLGYQPSTDDIAAIQRAMA